MATESKVVSFAQIGQSALLKIDNTNQPLKLKILVNEQLFSEQNIDNSNSEYFQVLEFTQVNSKSNTIKVMLNYDNLEPTISLLELDDKQLTAHKAVISVLTEQATTQTNASPSIVTDLTQKNLKTDFSKWALRRLNRISNENQNWPISFFTSFNLNQFSAEDIISQCTTSTLLLDQTDDLNTAIKVQVSAQLAATLYVYSKHHGQLSNNQSSELTQSQFLNNCGRIFTQLDTPKQASLDLDIYAKNLYQRVLETLSTSPQWLTADILHHLWFYYNFKDNHSLALETAINAIAKAEKLPEFEFLLPELYSNAFLSSYRVGAFAQAHNYLNKGLNLDTKTNDLSIAALLFSKGFLFHKTGEFDTGARYFSKTINQVQGGLPSEQWNLKNCLDSEPKQKLMIARAAVMIGATTREENQLTESGLWLQCAEHLLKEQNDYYQIVLQVEQAKTAIKQKQFSQPKVHLDNIFADPRTLPETQIDAKILQLKIDNVHLGKPSNKQELDKLAALLNYDSFFHENIGHQENTILPIKQIEAFTLLVQISQQEKLFKWVDIFADKAMSLIERNRLTVANPQAWNAARFGFINTYISSLLDKGRIQQQTEDNYAKLFEVLEKYYSVDPKQEKNLFSIDDVASENDQQVKRLYDIWLNEEKMMLLSDSADKQQKLYDARDDYLARVGDARQSDSSVAYISLDTFQKLLPFGQMLVRYFSDGQTMFALDITRTSQEVREIAQVPELAIMVESYVTGTASSSKPWLNKRFRDIPLLPIDTIEQQDIDKILIIPDESLHKMPFSMWNTAKNNQRYLPLVKTAQSVFITSATSYLESSAAPESENFEIAIFANPDFTIPTSDGATGSSPNYSSLFNVSSLPGTLNEAEFMANLFAGQQISRGIAENATSQFLMSKKVRNSKILHIGTHGYFDKKYPDIVGVLTAGEKVQGAFTPGFLSLNQLLSKPVSAELVFISGCETMVGKNYKGSGMRSITRGFLAQGAKTVVGTIWAIQDRPTSEFVKTFYSNLIDSNGDAPKALQMTQNDFHTAGRYRHPKYWAGFVLTSSNQADSHMFSQQLAVNLMHK